MADTHLDIDVLKRRIDTRLNDHLIEMRPDYDDSITGFNEAWDIVRRAFAEVSTQLATGRSTVRC
jgi:hypothetical protein